MRDPALRQSPLLGALDQVREKPAAGGPRLDALLRAGHERLGRDRLSFQLDGDVDLLGEAGRDAFLAQHRFLRRQRDLEQHAVHEAVLVLGQVGDAATPEAALHVEHQPVPAQERRGAAREEPSVHAVLGRPFADVSLRQRGSVREIAEHAHTLALPGGRDHLAGLLLRRFGQRLVQIGLERLPLAVQGGDHVVQ